jgi:hypothetical protein
MKNIKFSFTLTLLGLLSITSGIINADSGEFEYSGSALHNLKNINFGEVTYTGGHLTGAIIITKSTGGPFKEGMAGAMECVVFSEKSGNNTGLVAPCHMKFTGVDDGLNLLAKRNIGTIQSSGSGGKGTQELYGTGGMKNIKGTCEYTVKFHALNQNTTLGKCKWSN